MYEPYFTVYLSMSEQEKSLPQTIEQTSVPASPEAPVQLEQASQSFAEKPSQAPADTAAPVSSILNPPPEIKEQVLKKAERVSDIERILEDDLSEVYFNLPEDKRAAFRAQGEQTAEEIDTMLGAAKVKVNKIITLIKKWLLLIPGINKFFLEQEAKLKTDQIIKLQNKM